MIRRTYESVPEFFNARDARACVEDVNRYFGAGAGVREAPTTQPNLVAHAIDLPDALVGDERVLVETFIVAWGAGNEYAAGVEKLDTPRAALNHQRTFIEIVAALLRMLDKPASSRPFVVIEDADVDPLVSGGFFVQFCTTPPDQSNKHGLIFDVPSLKLTYAAFESAVGCKNLNEIVDGAAAMAVALLRDRGVVRVRIVEHHKLGEPVGGES